MNIGSLEFDFLANVARLQQDMAEVKKAVGGATDYVSSAASKAKMALGGIVAGLSLGAFATWVKGAIDAADAMDEMSSRVGIGASELTKLSVSYKMAGMDQSSMQTSLVKLSKAIADDSDELKKLGVATRDSNGQLRSADAVLRDVAKSFKGMEDGTNKTATAVELFGKSGADMVGMLNGGTEGLDEMAQMAERLGIVMDDQTAAAAAQFNDTLDFMGMATQGVATQLAAKMLPALNSVVGGLVKFVTEGDFVRKTADAIGVGLKGLYTGGVLVAEIFNTIGKTAGAAVAQIVHVMKGDFDGAMRIGQEWAADMKKDWTGTMQNIGDVWDDTAAKTVEGMGKIESKTVPTTKSIKDNEKAANDAAKAYENWNKKVSDLGADLRSQIETGEKLSAGQKLLKELTDNNTEATRKLTAEKRAELIEEAKLIIALEDEVAERERQKKAMEETAKENDKFTDSLHKSTEAIQNEVEKLRESNAIIGLNAEETAKLEIAKLEEQAVAKDRLATWAEENMLGEDIVEQYRAQAAGLRELAQLKGEKVHLEAAVEARDAWTATTQEIGQSFTNSLFRAFEEGKSFGDAFMDSLKNLFKTTVLKLFIQPVQQGMNNMLGGMFGGAGGGAGGAGGGFGNLLGTLGNGLSTVGGWLGEGSTVGGWLNTAGGFLKGGASGGLGSMFGNFGAGWGVGAQAAQGGISSVWNMGTGMMNAGATQGGLGALAGGAATLVGGFMGGRALGQMVSGGYGLGGGSGNTAVNIGSAIGAIWGPLGSAIGGAIGGLVNRAFGRKAKEVQEAGVTGTVVGGDFSGQQFADWFQKGGWFRSDKRGTDLSVMDAELGKVFDQSAALVYSQVEGYAKALGLPTESLKNVSHQMRIVLGEDEKKNEEAINQAFGAYQTKLAEQFRGALTPFVRAGETLLDTMARLSVLEAFSATINEFGGIFSNIAGLSIDAREQLIGFAGGIEAFVAKTQSFVDNYYTEAEKFGLQSAKVLEYFQSLGLDAEALQTRDDFRRLVEAQDVNTEEGRKMLAALLDIAPTFAGVADYLTKAETTLGQAAEQAPQVAALESLFESQQEANATQQEMVDTQTQTNDLLDTIAGHITAGNGAIVAAVGGVGAAIDRLAGGFEDWSSRALVAMP